MENQATSNLSSEKKLTVNTHFLFYMCNTINVNQTPSAFLHVCCLVWRPKIVCILGFDVPLLVVYVVNVSLHPKTVIMLDIFIIKLKVMVIYTLGPIGIMGFDITIILVIDHYFCTVLCIVCVCYWPSDSFTWVLLAFRFILYIFNCTCSQQCLFVVLHLNWLV